MLDGCLGWCGGLLRALHLLQTNFVDLKAEMEVIEQRDNCGGPRSLSASSLTDKALTSGYSHWRRLCPKEVGAHVDHLGSLMQFDTADDKKKALDHMMTGEAVRGAGRIMAQNR